MAKKFKDLVAKMPVEHQRRAKKRTAIMLAEMALQDLRKAQNVTQEAVANALAIRQASVSELERREDTHLSTLRKYIEAIGGQLDVVARFPDFSVRLNQFDGEKANNRDGSKYLTDSGAHPEF